MTEEKEWNQAQVGQFYVDAGCAPGYVAQRVIEEQQIREQMIREILEKAAIFGFPRKGPHA